MLNRKLLSFGLHPVLAYIILPVAFSGISLLLFHQSEFAVYFYMVIAIAVCISFSDGNRNEFLKGCFGDKKFRKIRVAENLIIIVPFVLFLFYKLLFAHAALLALVAVFFSVAHTRSPFHLIIPTPFYKRPFEFTVGFRNSYLLLMLAYVLSVVAVWADNFNLGVFSLLLIILTVLNYYTKLEHEYYIWSFNRTPIRFLWSKIGTALLFTLLLCMPVLLVLGFGYSSGLSELFLFLAGGLAFVICMVAAKYAFYPSAINLPQVILMASSVYFLPLLIILIPYFLYQSAKRLKSILK